MCVRLQDAVQEHAMHARKRFRLQDQPSMRAYQDEQNHRLASGLGGRQCRKDNMRWRDVRGQGQHSQDRLSFGGRHRLVGGRCTLGQVLSLFQSEGLSGAFRLGAIRDLAEHARQYRVQSPRPQHRQHRSGE